MKLILGFGCIGLLALQTVSTQAGAIRDLPGFATTTYGPNDDGTYPCTGMGAGIPGGCTPVLVPIGFNINFYGEVFSNLYVNNNGNVTFDDSLGTYTPFGLVGTDREIIAPFFGDVDTRVGNVVTFGNDTVDGHPAFGVDWIDVGYYSEETDKLNSFQLILIDRSDRNPGDFDIEYNYDQIQWETGDASDGTDGLGGSSAVVGFSNGSGVAGTYFQLPGSAIPGELLDTNPGGLIYGYLNTNVPGRYVFPIVNISNLVLDVPRLSQGDPRWATNAYAGSDTNITIQRRGCALTTLAMALIYNGVTTDPGALNTLMIDDDDYVGFAVNWGPATRDASSGQALQFHSYRTSDTEYLSQTLANGNPVIVGVNLNPDGAPGHFVLVIGYQDGQYVIDDPGHADRTNLDQYNNEFETRGYVGGVGLHSMVSVDGSSPVDVSGFDASVGDAADVMVTDPLGRRTGYDPVLGVGLEEIPQSAHFLDCVEDDDLTGEAGTNTAHMVDIYEPAQGNYQTLLTGTNTGGSYQLSVRAFTQAGAAETPIVQQGSITPGAIISNSPVNIIAAFTVTPSAGTNGGISPSSPQPANLGSNVSFTASPNSGYAVNQWLVNSNLAQTGGNSFTLSNVTANATVQVTFIAQYTVTPGAGANGGISPSAPQVTNSGSNVSFTASPNPGYLVNQWLVNSNLAQTGGNSFTLTNVTANQTVQVTFAVQASPPVAGTYQGLFYDAGGVALQSSGFFNATTSKRAGVSGNVELMGKTYAFSGQFATNGSFSKPILRRGTNFLTVYLQFATGGEYIVGQVSNATWVAQVLANRSVFNARTNHAPQAGKYTLVIPGSDLSAQPGGNGVGALTVATSGSVAFAGTLGDGTRVSQTAILSTNGLWPFYASLYSGNGSILGWLTFTNTTNADLQGLVSWIKSQQPASKLYAAGFTNQIETVGSKYHFTNGLRLLNLTNGSGSVVLDGGNLSKAITNEFSLGNNNRITDTNKLDLTISTSSGLFSGSVTNPADARKRISFNGVVLQKQNAGYGYFLGTTNSGSVSVKP